MILFTLHFIFPRLSLGYNKIKLQRVLLFLSKKVKALISVMTFAQFYETAYDFELKAFLWSFYLELHQLKGVALGFF